jgi:hypothetical protein
MSETTLYEETRTCPCGQVITIQHFMLAEPVGSGTTDQVNFGYRREHPEPVTEKCVDYLTEVHDELVASAHLREHLDG